MTEKAKKRKEWRSPEGSVFCRKEKVRASSGKMIDQTIWLARKRYTDPLTGKPREKTRKCATQSEALAALRRIKNEIADERLEKEKAPEECTFFELIDLYLKEYVKPALFSGNQKVAGFREPIDRIEKALEYLKNFFGDVPLSNIKHSDVKRLKETLLDAPVKIESVVKIPLTAAEKLARPPRSRQIFRTEKRVETRPRSVATVNRLLGRLRRIFNVAVQNEMVTISPFKRGDSLISQAHENERLRLLSSEEEKRLLAVCFNERAHLRPVIICALDTAMRRGEILSLRWQDIDLEKRVIRIQALNTKTLRSRIVPVSSRLKDELEKIKEFSFLPSPNERVFPFDSIQNGFGNARALAGIEDLHFHDLRGTGITRMLQSGMSAPEVMKISGHSQFRTFMRYCKIGEETAQRAGTALDGWLEKAA